MDVTSLPTSNHGLEINRLMKNYQIKKVIKENAKGNVYLANHFSDGYLFSNNPVIIKQGNMSIPADESGRTMKDRLKWQRHIHQLLCKELDVPEIVDYFRYKHNYYLVMEYIPGKTFREVLAEIFEQAKWNNLDKIKRRTVFRLMLQVTDLIHNMHSAGYVHRDITPENFLVTKDQDVFVIDLELAYKLDASPASVPFGLGTPGFMSPEQHLSHTPTVSEDIFAIGALMITAFTNLPPIKFDYNAPERMDSAMEIMGLPKPIRNIILRCLAPDKNQRPQLSELRAILNKYYISEHENRRPLYPRGNFNQPYYEKVDLMLDEAFSIMLQENMYNKRVNSGLSIPIHGAFYLISEFGTARIPERVISHFKKAYQADSNRYHATLNADLPGLFCGLAGNALGLYCGFEAGTIPRDENYSPDHEWLDSLAPSLGLADGIAGQAMAALLMLQMGADQVLEDKLNYLIHFLLYQQKDDGTWPVEELRLADGSAGILLTLIKYYSYKQDKELKTAIVKGLNAITTKVDEVRPLASGPMWRVGDISLMGGTSGIALTFLSGYEILKDYRYVDQATRMLSFLKKQINIPDYSIESGVTGIGLAYIEAARITRQPLWEEHVFWIYHVLERFYIRIEPDYITWNMHGKPENDVSFLSGNTGVVYFLLRMQEMLSYNIKKNKKITLI